MTGVVDNPGFVESSTSLPLAWFPLSKRQSWSIHKVCNRRFNAPLVYKHAMYLTCYRVALLYAGQDFTVAVLRNMLKVQTCQWFEQATSGMRVRHPRGEYLDTYVSAHCQLELEVVFDSIPRRLDLFSSMFSRHPRDSNIG